MTRRPKQWRCAAVTTYGTPCKNRPQPGSRHCGPHQGFARVISTRTEPGTQRSILIVDVATGEQHTWNRT